MTALCLAALVIPPDFLSITLGNVLTVVCGIIALMVAFQKISDKVDSNTYQITQHARIIEKLSDMGVLNTLAEHGRRIQLFESALSSLAALMTDVAWIKRELERNGLNHREGD